MTLLGNLRAWPGWTKFRHQSCIFPGRTCHLPGSPREPPPTPHPPRGLRGAQPHVFAGVMGRAGGHQPPQGGTKNTVGVAQLAPVLGTPGPVPGTPGPVPWSVPGSPGAVPGSPGPVPAVRPRLYRFEGTRKHSDRDHSDRSRKFFPDGTTALDTFKDLKKGFEGLRGLTAFVGGFGGADLPPRGL